MCNLPQLMDMLKPAVFALPLTLMAYIIAVAIYRLGKQAPLFNPVLIGMAVVITALTGLNIPYADYFNGAQVLHFLLGTATVALAIPLYHQLHQLRAAMLPIVLSVITGAAVAAVSAVLVAKALGGSTLTLISLAPKSTTTPVAMGIAERLGGLPPLTAVAVIVTGILGAITGLGILKAMGIHSVRSQGIALGIAAHGIGTARALQVDQRVGAYSGLAMSLTAVATAILVPLIIAVLGPWLS